MAVRKSKACGGREELNETGVFEGSTMRWVSRVGGDQSLRQGVRNGC